MLHNKSTHKQELEDTQAPITDGSYIEIGYRCTVYDGIVVHFTNCGSQHTTNTTHRKNMSQPNLLSSLVVALHASDVPLLVRLNSILFCLLKGLSFMHRAFMTAKFVYVIAMHKNKPVAKPKTKP